MIAFPEPRKPDSDPVPDPGSLHDTEALADTEALGDEIARLAAHIHAATYRLLSLIREFDEREGWGTGFRSCADWLSWRTGISPGPAREKVRVARALGGLPRIGEAMARGALSYSKVRALTRVADATNEEELVELARHATAAQLERLVRGLRRVDRLADAEAAAEAEAQRHRNRSLTLFPDDDGSWVIRGRLDPEVGAVLEKALEWAREALYRREPAGSETSPEQRLADALGLVAERALQWEGPTKLDPAGESAPHRAPGTDVSAETGEATGEEGEEVREKSAEAGAAEPPAPVSRAERFQVVLHVNAATGNGAASERDAEGEADVSAETPCHPSEEEHPLGPAEEPTPVSAETLPPVPGALQPPAAALGGSGLALPAETARRLACDADLVEMSHGADGGVLDVGRKRRTVPPALRRALDHRDGGCRFPGCTCRYTDAHHIVHWSRGGETKLENLVLLCRVHHRAVHEEGYRIQVAEGIEPAEGIEAAEGKEVAERKEVAEGGGALRFFRPDGELIPAVPEAPALPADPLADLVRGHRARGIDPGAWTATPLWQGETLDLGLAIDMLRGLGEGSEGRGGVGEPDSMNGENL